MLDAQANRLTANIAVGVRPSDLRHMQALVSDQRSLAGKLMQADLLYIQSLDLDHRTSYAQAS